MCYRFVQIIIDILIVPSSIYIIVVIKIDCTVTLSIQTKLFYIQYSSTQTTRTCKIFVIVFILFLQHQIVVPHYAHIAMWSYSFP